MRDFVPWPTPSQGDQVDGMLDGVVAAVDPRQWYRLLDATVKAIRRALPPAPAEGVCVCGARLFGGSGCAGPVHTHESDYGYSFQPQRDVMTGGGHVRFVCEPSVYEHTTVADVMCVACERLYRLPCGATKVYE